MTMILWNVKTNKNTVLKEEIAITTDAMTHQSIPLLLCCNKNSYFVKPYKEQYTLLLVIFFHSY